MSAAATRRILPVLRSVFGLDSLRPGQREVIERVLRGEATLAVMPTGAGKSLCYQLPALLLDGRTVVVSPLIALMKDQCERLQDLGVTAVALNSALGAQEQREAEAALADGSARVAFVTPERLASKECVDAMAGHRTALLVVDEAHCISQWGHDFRPAFLDIAPALAALGRPAVLALTATANRAVADDIATQLGIPQSGVVRTGTYRPNLRLVVETLAREDDKLERLRALVAPSSAGAGIVYAATVKAAEAVHAALAGMGVTAALYHGRLAARRRAALQEDFMQGRQRVMVATNAFGLGIDHEHLRFVLHWQVPSGLDAYYQEAGRAGRDGDAATCTLLYRPADKAVQQFFLAGRYPLPHDLTALYEALSRPPPEAAAAWTLDALQRALQRPRAKLQTGLALLRRQRIVAQDRSGRLRLLRAGLGAQRLAALGATYADKRAEDQALLEQMVFYAQSGWCRWRVLLEHFEARPQGFDRCGHCDNCVRMAQHERQQAAAAASPEPRDPAPAARAGFAPGEAVTVRRYGRGRVTAADALSVEVEFPTGERRCFLPDWVGRVGMGRGRHAPRRAAAGPGG